MHTMIRKGKGWNWVGFVLMALVLSGCKPSVSFTSDQASIVKGDAVTLSWQVSSMGGVPVTSVTLEPDQGEVAKQGELVVNPMETTHYTLTATATNSSGETFVATKTLTLTISNLCSRDDVDALAASATLDTAKLGDFIPLCDGDVYIGNQSTNSVDLRNVFSGELITTYPLPSAPRDMEMDGERGLLYVSLAPATSVAVINTLTDEVNVIRTPVEMNYFSVASDGRVFMSGGGGYRGTLYILQEDGTITGGWPMDGAPIRYNNVTGEIVAATFGLSPASLYRYGFDDAGELVELQALRSGGGNGQALAISADGEHLALASGGGNGPGYTIYDFSPADFSVVHGEWNTGAYPSGAAFSLDSKLFAASNYDEFLVFDVDTHVELMRVPAASCSYGSISTVDFSRGGKLVFARQVCGFDDDTGRIFVSKIAQ